MLEVRRLAQQGRAAEGVALVARSSERGDPEASFTLANWRLWGLYGPRDLQECHELLAKAAGSGWVEATRLRANLVANGTGCAADFDAGVALLQEIAPVDEGARKQLELVSGMPSIDALAGLPREELSTAPAISIIRNLLSRKECEYLIDKAAPALKPSLVVDPRTRRTMADPVRTSSGMNFDPSQEDLVVNAVNRRIAAVTETDYECGEMLSILSYGRGEEYRPHVDSIPGAVNQHRTTALVYLNQDYVGGETSFIHLGLEVRGERGDCLVFQNATEDGGPDMASRHAGLPVTEGTKWIASRWIRERPYDPFAEG